MHWNSVFLGVAVLAVLLPFAQGIPKNLGVDMPSKLAFILSYLWFVGFIAGISLVVVGVFPTILKRPFAGVLFSALVGAAFFGSGTWVYFRYQQLHKQAAEPPVRETSDVTWSFDAVPGSYFLGMAGGQGQEPWIDSFQAKGRNNLDEPIAPVSGFVRSDITNAQFLIRFVIGGQRVPPEDTRGIPRNAEFDIASEPFPSSDRRRRDTGLTASVFLVEFATFTFVFEYDGKRFVRHFTNEEIRKQVEAFQRASQTSVPSVMRRQPTSGTEGQ
jgi:hypothetical protein